MDDHDPMHPGVETLKECAATLWQAVKDTPRSHPDYELLMGLAEGRVA